MSYVSPTRHPLPPPARPDAAPCVVPRADSILLVADAGGAEVHLGGAVGPAAARQPLWIEPGKAHLLATGERALRLHGTGFQALPLPGFLIRLLAFHDHAMDLQRSLVGDKRQPALLAIDGDLKEPEAAQRWVMGQLLEGRPVFHDVAARWARREAYQLVRFVLENPDDGVQQLADRYGLSVAQFRRIGRKAFGRSLKEQLRLLRARRVLHRYADTGHTFTRLSSDFGFSSPSHFCSEIKSLLGRSPSSIFHYVNSP